VSRGADDVTMLDVRFEKVGLVTIKASECFLQNERDDTVDDLVRSDFLHEPGYVCWLLLLLLLLWWWW